MNIFEEVYEKLLIEAIESNEFDVNNMDMPKSMKNFFNKVFKKDPEYINEVFRKVVKEDMENEKQNTDETQLLKSMTDNFNDYKLNDKDLNFKEIIEKIHWNKNKFIENIDIMCSKDVYDIDKWKFKKAGSKKEDYYKEELEYCFKKEWSDIALLLFEMFGKNPYFRKNCKITSVNLDSIIQYNQEFLDNIEEKLNIYTSLEIMLHPVYEATYTEKLVMEKVKEKLNLFFSIMSQEPIEARANMWIKLSEKIDELIIADYVLSKKAKNQLEKDKGQVFKNQLYGEYENTSLDKYLAQLLKREMDEEFRKERISINNKKIKMMKLLDRVAMELDGEEEVNRVNEMWNNSKQEKKRVEEMITMYKKIAKGKLEKAKNKVERLTNINNNIDRLIEYEQKNDGLENVILLNQLKEEIAEIESNMKFEESVKELLQHINFNVLNRK